MCGIAAIVRAKGAPAPDERTLLLMREALAHRGPDDAGVHIERDVGLSFRRLSIIDLEGGHQPMANEDGTVIVVYNGEIYNFQDLREALRGYGHVWRTRSDTEVLLHGYETWGIEGLLDRLNGMFAFALWDRTARTLHAARDRIGIKPLYYAESPEGIVLASDFTPFRFVPWIRRELDEEALRFFLSLGYIPAPLSVFRSIRKLEPGCRIEYCRGRLDIRRYWTLPDPVLTADGGTNGRMAAHLMELLEDSVRRRMVSDVPVGLFLSAGLDSSAICSIFTSYGNAGTPTFSVGFDEPGYSELEGAQSVADRYGARNWSTTVPVPDEPFLRELVRSTGEPFADSSLVNVFHLSRLARERVTVALSGDGGDEVLGGYETYIASGLAPYYAALPAPLRRAVVSAEATLLPPGTGKVGARMKLGLFLHNARRSPVESHFSWRRIIGPGDLRYLASEALHDDGFEERYYARVHDLVPRRGELDPLNLLMYLDIRAYLADDMLVKVDRASMWHALEVRVPFLDHRIVEWAMSVPGRAKVGLFRTKTLLREALKGRVPEEVRRMRKAGFNAPLSHWFRGACGMLLERLAGEGACDRCGLERAAVLSLLEEHREGRADHSHKLWNLLVLTIWRDELLRGEWGA